MQRGQTTSIPLARWSSFPAKFPRAASRPGPPRAQWGQDRRDDGDKSPRRRGQDRRDRLARAALFWPVCKMANCCWRSIWPAEEGSGSIPRRARSPCVRACRVWTHIRALDPRPLPSPARVWPGPCHRSAGGGPQRAGKPAPVRWSGLGGLCRQGVFGTRYQFTSGVPESAGQGEMGNLAARCRV